ncbi:hypothetical protein [Nocardia amamiensis]|uniref:hypothetical protein n=1 Tax=Nocardia amamiensis TaxID=404578 RepID=UPI00082F2580|nr:hypothetical protein [Nocardia amamiensis]
MRYTVSALGVLAAAGIAAAPFAGAATGVLIIDNTTYREATGCLHVGDGSDVEVRNYTDTVVRIYDSPECSGDVVDILEPGERDVLPAYSVDIEDFEG